MNPLAFWNREAAAEHGFQTVKQSLLRHYDSLRSILGAYGIQVDADAIGEHLRAPLAGSGAEREAARAAQAKAERGEPDETHEKKKRPFLRLVSGGR